MSTKPSASVYEWNEVLHVSLHKRLLEVLLKSLIEITSKYRQHTDVRDRVDHVIAQVEEVDDDFIEILQVKSPLRGESPVP